MVVLRIREVDGGAGHLDARLEHRVVDAMPVEALAAECGDQRRMHVEGASVELPARLEGRQEAQQGDELRAVLLEGGVDRVVERADVGMALARHGHRGNPATARALEPAGLLPRRDHDDELRRHFARVDALRQVLEACPFPREKDTDPQRRVRVGCTHPSSRLWKMLRVAGDLFSV